MATAERYSDDLVATRVMNDDGYNNNPEYSESELDDLSPEVDNEFAGEFNEDDVDVDMNEFVEYEVEEAEEEEVCTCDIVSGSVSKSESGEDVDPEDGEVVEDEEEEVADEEEESEEVEAGEVDEEEEDEESEEVVEDDVASALASSRSDVKDSEGEETPRSNVEEVNGDEPTAEVESNGSDDLDVNDAETMKLAEEMQDKLLDAVSLENHVAEESCSLLDGTSPKSSPRKSSKKLKWVPKASTPAYMISATNKFKVEDIEKVSITTKGKAAKLAAAKIEKMAGKIKENKQKLKEESNLSKMSALQSREQVVAAEKARVNAAKKAREVEAERIRLEAIARRKNETNEKDRLKGLFEQKKTLLSQARQAVLRRNHDEVA